jgi:phenylpropionate dioxygenase-like ring-hydroxylating dioxygenase large terminal subunit
VKTARAFPVAANQESARTNELDAKQEALLYRAFRHFWHPVILSSELQEAPRAVVLCEQALVAVRLEGEICVFNDLCAHRGTALSLGAIVNEGTELRCAYHGWQYNKEGVCTLVPQRPELSSHMRARVRKFNACERYGMVWVCLEDEPRFDIPAFPEYDDPTFRKVFLTCSDWACSAPRRTENYCDLGHFAFVHDGYLGDITRPAVPDHEVWREDSAVRMRATYVEPAGTGRYDSLGMTGEVETLVNWTIDMPLNVRNVARMQNGFANILYFHPTPISPKVTRNFTVAARNYSTDEESMRAEVIEFNDIVYEQDRPIVESQRPEELPEDLSYELHVKGVDSFHLTYRRFLLDIARDLT